MAACARLVFFAVFLVPALALAQQPPPEGGPTGTPPAPPTTTVAPPAGAPPPVSSGPVTGFGWGGDTRPAPAPVRHYYAPTGPIAVLPGFEAMPDGSSRFYIELTKAVPVVEQKGQNGTLTYVLKGAHVAVYNNERPLVTVHFNTPVWRARLVPYGADLHFILELRANVAPTYKVDTAQSGRASLEIDFPAGQFLASDMPELPAPGVTTPPIPGGPPVPGPGSGAVPGSGPTPTAISPAASAAAAAAATHH